APKLSKKREARGLGPARPTLRTALRRRLGDLLEVWNAHQKVNSIALIPARKINENTETVGTNQNPDPTVINKTPRPIMSRKLQQPHSPNDYD
ncbi:Uncharacterized protein FWK35_00031951, partial [Aphis craccivora]